MHIMQRNFVIIIKILVISLMLSILVGSAHGDYGDYLNTTIEIENAEGSITYVTAGEIIDLNITIKNIGDTDIESIDVTLLPTRVIAPLTSIRTLSKLDEGESENLTFKICANDLEGTGAFPVSFRISYEDELERKEEKTLSVGIFIEKTESPGPPELRVTNVTLNPGILEPGEDLKLNISIKNVGDSEASNISVFLDTLRTPFAKIGYTRIYLERLSTGEEKNIEFTLASDRNALPKPYSIPLTIQYNKNGIQQEFEELIGIETKGKAKLSMFNITTYPANVKEDEDFDLMFDIENIGTGSARYCHVIVDFMNGGIIEDKYIGHIRSYAVKSVRFTLNVEKYGTLPYEVMIGYEDDRGECGISKNLTLAVEENPSFMEREENIIIFAAIIVVLVVFILIMLSKMKKQK